MNCSEIKISPALKNQINAAFLNLHYTIAENRPFMYAYGQNQELLISDNPNENYWFNGGDNNSTVTTIITSGIFLARSYDNVNSLDTLRENDGYVKAPFGTIFLTTDTTGRTLLDACTLADKRVVFNGKTYRVESDSANYGLLAQPFYDYRLSPSQ